MGDGLFQAILEHTCQFHALRSLDLARLSEWCSETSNLKQYSSMLKGQIVLSLPSPPDLYSSV